MKDTQLHEIVMLALSRTEFTTKNDPVGLAKEIFYKYNTIIDELNVLNKDFDDENEIDAFGMPQPTESSAKNHR